MVGVGYGKGIGEDEERWLTPEEIEAKQQRGERLRFFDARHESEYAAGTLPGAESLAQTAIMFNRDAIRTLIDDLLSGAGGASDLVFFANTGGAGGSMSAGRDVYVIAFLRRLGLPLARMSRLSGGLRGWHASGRPTPKPSTRSRWRPGERSFLPVDEWDGLLGTAALSPLRERLRPLLDDRSCCVGTTLSACVSIFSKEQRPGLLSHLKDAGLALADRQVLCNVIAKAIINGRLTTEEEPLLRFRQPVRGNASAPPSAVVRRSSPAWNPSDNAAAWRTTRQAKVSAKSADANASAAAATSDDTWIPTGTARTASEDSPWRTAASSRRRAGSTAHGSLRGSAVVGTRGSAAELTWRWAATSTASEPARDSSRTAIAEHGRHQLKWNSRYLTLAREIAQNATSRRTTDDGHSRTHAGSCSYGPTWAYGPT
jgi:hypothetical protein